MKKIILIVLLALPLAILGQTNTQNYVKSTSYRVPVSHGSQGTVSQDDKIENVSYYDGLGRPIQSIAQRAGVQNQGIISIIDYDGLGRTTKNYLPTRVIEGHGGNFLSNASTKASINSFYLEKYPEDKIDTNTINAYSETIYDGSWENRILEQGAPGNSWKVDATSDEDHTVKYEYGTNSISVNQEGSVIPGDDVLLFSIEYPIEGNLTIPQLRLDGVYPSSELYKNLVKDENWNPSAGKDHTTETFTNRKGQVILKRTYDNNIAHDTYYVYDLYDNLTFVLPPLAVDEIQRTLGYRNRTAQIPYTEFITESGTSGAGALLVSIVDNVITLDFDLTIASSQELRNGNYGTQLSIPDIYIGRLGFNPQDGETPIDVRVASGYLYISGDKAVSDLEDRLSALLPAPEGTVNPMIIEKLGYQYHYDDRNRLIEKRVPNKDWEFIVYDPLDRPVLVQSGILRENNQWLFTKYDALGRVTYTGVYTTDTACSKRESRTTEESNKWTEGSTTRTTTTANPRSRGCKRQTLQNTINNQSDAELYEQKERSKTLDNTTIYYTNRAFPTTNLELHTISYYDDYEFDWNYGGLAGFPHPNSVDSFEQTAADNIKGLATGSKIRVLDTDNWITSFIVYDHKRRPIYNATYNKELTTRNISKTELDHVGQVLQSEVNHQYGSQTPIVTKDFFTYDSHGRMITHKQQINNQAQELIVKNEYDEMGMLSRKRIGGNATQENGLQQVDYTYNIRGWVKGVNENMISDPTSQNSDLFGYHISYDQLQSNNGIRNSSLYNGNISETIWRTLNTDDNIKGYAYQYDALNRFINAQFTKKDIGSSLYQFEGDYRERIGQYDKNGNILSLWRTGPMVSNGKSELWDHLDYDYRENQLNAIREIRDVGGPNNNRAEGFVDGVSIGKEYNYDMDGNLLQDLNKGINMTYNHLHLPTSVTRLTQDVGTISYVYDALGTKLKKTVNSTTKIYNNGFVYTDDILSMISQPEGYVEKIGSTFEYVYNYVDHLGNVRLTYKDSNGNGSVSTSEIIEEKNYYPFGLQHKGYNFIVQGENSAATQFGYNGMEKSSEFGLETLDFGARNYDPAIGRWMNIDPLAEQMRRHSPYNYAFNNPVFFIDPDGMSPVSSLVSGDSISANDIENSAFGNQTFGVYVGAERGSGSSDGQDASSNGGIQIDSKNQSQFKNDVLKTTFGENANKFSFNDKENLNFEGKKKDFAKSEKKALKVLLKGIKLKVVTKILFTDEVEINGTTIPVIGEGGAITILAADNEGLNYNIIAVNPNANLIEDIATDAIFDFKSQTVKQVGVKIPTTTAVRTFHELGHVIYKNNIKVIGIDNLIRSIQKRVNGNGLYIPSPLRSRPPKDLTHSQLNTTTKN